jgi:LEA14-like dessication related protein
MVPPKPRAAIIALLTLTVLLACAPKVVRPTVEVLGVDEWDIEAESSSMVVIVEVTNPNAFGGTLAGAEYRVKVNGTVVGEGRQDTAYEIPAEGSCRISLPLKLDHYSLLLAILLGDLEELRYAVRVKARLETAYGVFEDFFEQTGRTSLSGLLDDLFQ